MNTSIEVLEMSNGYLDTALWERILWVVDTRLQRVHPAHAQLCCLFESSFDFALFVLHML